MKTGRFERSGVEGRLLIDLMLGFSSESRSRHASLPRRKEEYAKEKADIRTVKTMAKIEARCTAWFASVEGLEAVAQALGVRAWGLWSLYQSGCEVWRLYVNQRNGRET
jgi:hypothetical protein